MYLLERAVNSEITLVNVTMFNNSNGGLKILTGNESIWLNFLSSSFSYNTNEALMLQLSKRSDHCNIVITNFTKESVMVWLCIFTCLITTLILIYLTVNLIATLETAK